MAGTAIGVLGLIGTSVVTVVWVTGSVLVAAGIAIYVKGKMLEKRYVAGN